MERTHCLGHAALLPRQNGPTQSTRPPRLRHVWWEELWLFVGVIVQEFDRRKQIGVFKEEEVEKKGKTEREFWKGRRSLCLDYKGTPY